MLHSSWIVFILCVLNHLVVSNSCDPIDCNLPGSCVHGIFQARILERVSVSFSRGSFWPRNRTQVSCNAGRFFTLWATREDRTIINEGKDPNRLFKAMWTNVLTGCGVFSPLLKKICWHPVYISWDDYSKCKLMLNPHLETSSDSGSSGLSLLNTSKVLCNGSNGTLCLEKMNEHFCRILLLSHELKLGGWLQM